MSTRCSRSHQPVAADLRFIVTVLQVNNDFERMGDLAKNIAKRSLDLDLGRKLVPSEMREMAERVQTTVSRSLDALVRMVSISRQLEHIADLATNIAEDVVFTVEGEVVRHGGWESGGTDVPDSGVDKGLRAV